MDRYDRAIRLGRRLARRTLRSQCEVWRQAANAGAYELLDTVACGVQVVNRDRDVLSDDPEDADAESLNINPIHFAADSDVQGSDYVYWVDGDVQYFVESVGFGTYSATKRVLGSVPRMEGVQVLLRVSRETSEATGARAFLADQVVYEALDNLVRDFDTVAPKRRGKFIKNGAFDIAAGDTWLIVGTNRVGYVTGVHRGQVRRVEADFVEGA